jgi:predicted nucleotidyltransferase
MVRAGRTPPWRVHPALTASLGEVPGVRVPIGSREISDTAGHKSTHVTQTVYRHVLRPALIVASAARSSHGGPHLRTAPPRRHAALVPRAAAIGADLTRWEQRQSNPRATGQAADAEWVLEAVSRLKASPGLRRYSWKVTDDVLTMQGLRRRRAEILGVAQKRRAHRIAVFGSVARGEAGPDSDLDLLVDFEPGASLLDHVGLFQDLEELLGVGVDVVTRNALKPRDEHIRAEAVDL